MTALLLLCLLAQTSTAPAKPVPPGSTAPPPARIIGGLPVYPDDARQRRIGGVVSVNATIDAKGKVVDVKALRAIPVLASAAADAVRHWEYKTSPAMAGGSPAPALLPVVFYFDGDTGRVDEVQRISPQGPQPRKTKNVLPVYPAQETRSRQAGRVIIEAVVNRAGKVIDMRVQSASGGFESAAREAVRQYEYEPLVVDGAAVPFVLTVTVLFSQR